MYIPTRLAVQVALTASLAGCTPGMFTAVPADAVSGQLITAETIRESDLSTAWQVLRRYGTHLTLREDARSGAVAVNQRGRESILLPEVPLLIVDGVVVTDLRVLTLMPARDVETINVIPGSAASSRYGMRAASGAIVLQTAQPESNP